MTTRYYRSDIDGSVQPYVVWSAKLLSAPDLGLRAGWIMPLNLLPDYVQVKDGKIVSGGHFDNAWKTGSAPQP